MKWVILLVVIALVLVSGCTSETMSLSTVCPDGTPIYGSFADCPEPEVKNEETLRETLEKREVEMPIYMLLVREPSSATQRPVYHLVSDGRDWGNGWTSWSGKNISSSTGCHKGSKEGENVNFVYCGGFELSRQIVDDTGVVQPKERIQFALVFHVLDWDDKTAPTSRHGVLTTYTKINYLNQIEIVDYTFFE